MSMIYQKAEPIYTHKTRVNVSANRSVRESANLLKQAVVFTIGAIGVIAWSIALGALI